MGGCGGEGHGRVWGCVCMGGCGGVCMGVTGAGGHVKERLSDLINLVSFPDLHTYSVRKLGMYRDLIYIAFVFWKPV